MTKYFLGKLITKFYSWFYKLDSHQEIFKGYLSHYLGSMGLGSDVLLLHNERVARQLEFLELHNYKCDYQGAVFIAGCIYAERVLAFPTYHQCLSFGVALSDLFSHRHQFVTMSVNEVISQSLERVHLTETRLLSKQLNTVIKQIVS